MRLRELIAGLDAALVGEEPGDAGTLRICDLTEDSRTVMPGSLFIARRGEKADGRSFVTQAIDAGAVAVLTDDPALRLERTGAALLLTPDVAMTSALLAERFYGDPAGKLTLIGVTGTNGKTTIAFLVHQMLNALGVRCGLMGTVCIDDGTEIAPATLTTSPALEVSRTLARMVEAGCRAAVMEVSSHALHQRRVGALRFDAAIFTNLTGDHLDYHGTMDAYAQAKRELFGMIRPRSDAGGKPGSGKVNGLAIVNGDDQRGKTMLEARTPGSRAVVCRVQEREGRASPREEGVDRAVVHVRSMSPSRMRLGLEGPWSEAPVEVDVPLVGAFNAMNVLQAVVAVHGLYASGPDAEIEFARVVEALSHVSPPPGRLEPVARADAPLSVFVDYAHTDDALRTTLSTLRRTMGADEPSMRGKRARSLVCVFGCGGDRDRTKRPRMGLVAAELADQIIVTSDNPRTEDPNAIIAQVLEGVPISARERVVVEPDRERAIRLAIRRAQAAEGGTGDGGGDVIAICGKGHEDYQILPDPVRPGQTITRHFDDREIARSALAMRGIATRAPWSMHSHEHASEDLLLSESLDATDAFFEPPSVASQPSDRS